MPVAKVKANPDAMKLEEGKESLDTIIRHAIGKEPFLSVSRAGDTPVQWIQLLHALDQQDLPGWPLLSPVKTQMQKCDKCSQEFGSPINYRRHIRVDHRLKNLDKDSSKNRDLLGAFWDKLTLDEAKEIVSLNNVTLEDVPGSSIIKALATLVRKPGFTSMPQVYLKAGSALLDIVQARPSRLPISSQELFNILDDASERTFFRGTAISVQKYVFDGEAGKTSLETRNLVACTSFLMEQELVKAWLADQDAEALRCQKLLVEEEEAAQKRQAEIAERKRQKKLRQKEQKAKQQRCWEDGNIEEGNGVMVEAHPPAETSSDLAELDSRSHNTDQLPDHNPSSLESFQLSNSDEDGDTGAQSGNLYGHNNLGTCPNVERQTMLRNDHHHIARWKSPLKSRGVSNGCLASHHSQALMLQRHGIHRDLKANTTVNSNKIWSRKIKMENGVSTKTGILQKEEINNPDQNMKHEVLIGSISVSLGHNSGQREGYMLTGARDNPVADHQMEKNDDIDEKPVRPDSAQCSTDRSSVKLWRPVSRHETPCATPAQSGNRETEVNVIAGKANEQTHSDVNLIRACAKNDCDGGTNSCSPSLHEESSCPQSLLFSSQAAKAFLAQRWKEAMASSHVTLVLPAESVTPECLDVQQDCHAAAAAAQPSDINNRSILGNAENRIVNAQALESSAAGTTKPKFKRKTEKAGKKYIPKQSASLPPEA